MISAGDLQDTRLFAGLPPHELDAIASSGIGQTLPANTVFIRQGESSSSVFIILSGRSKVYLADRQGGHKVLGQRGPGEHVGEVAMLGDSVRTASVATLEESRFLVLSRRSFMQCLARNPQIGLNLEEAYVLRSMNSEVGQKASQRYRAWSAFRRSGLPLILLIGGCAGSGKSTLAAELALRLDIGRTQSTDLLREVMRLLIPEQSDPILHASTYQAWQAVPGTGSAEEVDDQVFIAGFRAQADRLALALDGVVSRSIKEQASTVIEGIHLHPDCCQRLEHQDAVVLPILLTVPSYDELKAHLTRRGEQAPARGAKRYLENLEVIWELQSYFIAEAHRCGIAMVENKYLNRTVDRIMEVISQRLVEQFSE